MSAVCKKKTGLKVQILKDVSLKQWINIRTHTLCVCSDRSKPHGRLQALKNPNSFNSTSDQERNSIRIQS
uniref:Uncharacterized protein n=1 Tax=Helianthus annuus TaxID=4232 RepID=A0A251UAJ1_HELAN